MFWTVLKTIWIAGAVVQTADWAKEKVKRRKLRKKVKASLASIEEQLDAQRRSAS